MSAIGATEVVPVADAETIDTSVPLVTIEPPRRSPGLLGRISVSGWRIIALIGFLVLWHLVSIPAGKLLLPSPLDIAPAFVDELRSGQLAAATFASMQVFLAGYVLAVV